MPISDITLETQKRRYMQDGTLQLLLISAAEAVEKNSLKARQDMNPLQIELNLALGVMRDVRYITEAIDQLRDIIVPLEYQRATETLDFVGHRLEGLYNPTVSVWSGGNIIMMAFEHRRPMRKLTVHWDVSQNPPELSDLKIEASAARAVSWIDKTIRMLGEGYTFVTDPSLDQPQR